MSQRCKICSHEKIKQINKSILANVSYRRLASQFEIPVKSVERHAKNHLKPIIDEANEQAKQEIVQEVLQYRKEVNYSALDKIKLLQDKILNDIDGSAESGERVPLYREFRGALQEEAKICGLYQKEAENEHDIQFRKIKAAIERRAREKNVTYEEEVKYYLENWAADVPAVIKTKLSSDMVH